jgi:hypothetical protein
VDSALTVQGIPSFSAFGSHRGQSCNWKFEGREFSSGTFIPVGRAL